MSKPQVYLCTMDELAGPGASEERVLKRMHLLAGILNKLGWDLFSGMDGRFHELWAIPRVAADADVRRRPPPAAAFEKALIGWMRSALRSFPEPVPGQPGWWTARVSEWQVELGINELRNGGWRLTIHEPLPREFTKRVALYFEKPESDPVFQDDGRVTTEFLGQDLWDNGFPGLDDNEGRQGGSGG